MNPRETWANPFDLNRSINTLFDRQQKMEPPFFKITDDGKTVDTVRHPIAGFPGRFLEFTINLGRSLRPGGGGISKVCTICLDAVIVKFPNELWLKIDNLILFFNPQPGWAPKPDAKTKDQPHHITMTLGGEHRSQKDIIEVDVLRAFRRGWMKLNSSPSLWGRTLYRMGFNGVSYRDNDPTEEYGAGASQDHAHTHLVRIPYAAENAPVTWSDRTIEGLSGVKIGLAQILPGHTPEESEIAIALEARGERNLKQLDEALHRLGVRITRGHITGNKDSINIFYFQKKWSWFRPTIRVFVTGRIKRDPTGFGQGWGHHETLAGMFMVAANAELFYEFTDSQRTEWGTADTPQKKIDLVQRWRAEGTLKYRSSEDAVKIFREAFKEVAYNRYNIFRLLSIVTRNNHSLSNEWRLDSSGHWTPLLLISFILPFLMGAGGTVAGNQLALIAYTFFTAGVAIAFAGKNRLLRFARNDSPEKKLAKQVARAYADATGDKAGAVKAVLGTISSNRQIVSAFDLKHKPEAPFDVVLFQEELDNELGQFKNLQIAPIKRMVSRKITSADLPENNLTVLPYDESMDINAIARRASQHTLIVVRTEQAAAQVKAALGTRSNVDVVIDQTGVFNGNRVVLSNLENLLVGMNILDRYTGLTLVFGKLERDYSNLNPRSRLLKALVELFDDEQGFLAMGFLGLATLDKVQEMIATKA